MTDVPKIVRHRLRTAGPGQDGLERVHPEADVLTAFAEQGLSATERDGVLQHLALCEDCRDIVVLALPAMDLTVKPAEPESAAVGTRVPEKARTNWLGWANLRWPHLSWAALAAGIALAVLVARPGLEHLAKPNPQKSSITTQIAAPAGPPAPTSQAVATKAGDAKPESADGTTQLAANNSRVEKPSPQAEGKLASAGKTRVSDSWPGNARNDSSTTAKLTPPAPSGTRAIETPRAMNETVAVPGAPTTTLTADASTGSNLMAQKEAPAIRRAKPALEAKVNEPTKAGGVGGASAQAMAPLNGMNTLVANGPPGTTLKQNPSWTIARGVLQRSLDGGQSWQIAVQSEHPLECYANRGQEIWAGGQAGTLLHSTDAGTTWTAVVVSFKGQLLGADISHIEMRGLTGIILATDNHESWSSTDGGKTWEKR